MCRNPAASLFGGGTVAFVLCSAVQSGPSRTYGAAGAQAQSRRSRRTQFRSFYSDTNSTCAQIWTVRFAHFVKQISVCAFIHTSVKTMARTRPLTPARPAVQYSPARITFSAFMFALQHFKHAED